MKSSIAKEIEQLSNLSTVELEKQLAATSSRLWNSKKLFEYFKSLYKLAEQNKHYTIQIRTLSYIINSFVSQRAVSEKALMYIRQAEKFLAQPIQQEDIRLRIRLHSSLILANLILRKYEEAEYHANQLYALYEMLEESPHPLYDSTIATMFYELEQYKKSWELLFRGEHNIVQSWRQYHKAPESFEQAEYHHLCLATINICKLSITLCLRFKNVIAAEEYIRFGLQFIADSKYDKEKSALWGFYSNIHLYKKEYDQALRCGLKVLETYNTSHAPFFGMFGHLIIGSAYFALQDMPNALANGEKAWFYATKFRDKTARLHPLIFYIECLLSVNGDLDKISSLLELINEYFQETRQQFLLFRKFHIESIYYQKLGEPEKALEALQQSNMLVQQVHSLDMATEFNRALTSSRDSFLQDSPFFHNLKNIIYRNLATTTDSSSLHEKVMMKELFQGMQTTIKKLYQEAPMLSKREIQHRLADIHRFLTDNFHDNQEAHEVQKELSHAHGEFLPIISRQFPQLSHTELRICVLLRFNLTTHQIADILSVAPDTVFTHRKNIRKKLNIPKSVELHTFLLALQDDVTDTL